MTSVLVVETDTRLVRVLGRTLGQRGVDVRTADRIESARELASKERFGLVMIESNLVSERDLFAFEGTPIVIIAAYLERGPAERLARSARLLQKPFTSAELCQVIDDEVGLPPRGDSLLDVLSRGHVTKSSFALSVGAGVLVLEAGELVHATLAEKRGEAALIEILAQGGAVRRWPQAPAPRSISRPFRPVLLDALGVLERLDEKRSQEAVRPSRGGQP